MMVPIPIAVAIVAVAAVPAAMGPAIVTETALQGGDRGAQQDDRAAVGKQSTHHISPSPAQTTAGDAEYALRQ